MKKYSLIYIAFSAILLSLTVLIFDACKGKEPSPTEDNEKLLTSGTWKIGSVKVDGLDESDLFTGLTLQFASNGTYTTSNGLPVWNASGAWSFKEGNPKLIVREDGIEVTVSSITNGALVLELVWDKTTLGTGRTNSINGEHVFSFTK